jgi:hypothetical protein
MVRLNEILILLILYSLIHDKRLRLESLSAYRYWSFWIESAADPDSFGLNSDNANTGLLYVYTSNLLLS